MSARIFAAGLAPRFMAFSPDGVLHVANMKVDGTREFSPPHDEDIIPAPEVMRGQILALPDRRGRRRRYHSGRRRQPVVGHEFAFTKAISTSVTATPCDATATAMATGYEQELSPIAELAYGDHHRTKTIQFDEINDKLYVSVGSSVTTVARATPSAPPSSNLMPTYGQARFCPRSAQRGRHGHPPTDQRNMGYG